MKPIKGLELTYKSTINQETQDSQSEKHYQLVRCPYQEKRKNFAWDQKTA